MRKYIANVEEDLWIDFTPEQYRELNITTLKRGQTEIPCKIIPIGDKDIPRYWICFPVKSFEVKKEK